MAFGNGHGLHHLIIVAQPSNYSDTSFKLYRSKKNMLGDVKIEEFSDYAYPPQIEDMDNVYTSPCSYESAELFVEFNSKLAAIYYRNGYKKEVDFSPESYSIPDNIKSEVEALNSEYADKIALECHIRNARVSYLNNKYWIAKKEEERDKAIDRGDSDPYVYTTNVPKWTDEMNKSKKKLKRLLKKRKRNYGKW